jgi:anti-sigma regulatory factor (Ser/Thr protein kinase)
MNTQTTADLDLGPRLLAVLEGKIDLLSSQLRERIAALSGERADPEDLEALATELVSHVTLFGGPGALEILRQLDRATSSALALFPRDSLIHIDHEAAIVKARKQAGATAARLGFRAVQRTKIVTATSELARNIHMYVGRGEVEIRVLLAPRPGMVVHARDQGPGIANLSDVLSGRLQSKRGMGMGLRGVKAMADEFDIVSEPGRGTSVRALFSMPSTVRG